MIFNFSFNEFDFKHACPRVRETDEAGKNLTKVSRSQGAKGSRNNPNARLTDGKSGVFRAEPDIAGRDQVESPAHAGAMNSSDHGFSAAFDAIAALQ